MNHNVYYEILSNELVPAMGCTEPIAIAYCAAKARDVLGSLPKEIVITASGNIIKNVKNVIVPNTNKRKGIEVAAAIVALAGNADAELEVLKDVTENDKAKLENYLHDTKICVYPALGVEVLDIKVEVFNQSDSASVRIMNAHTNIVEIVKNGEIIVSQDKDVQDVKKSHSYGSLSVADIYEFAQSCDLDPLQDILETQVTLNSAIAKEGLTHNYGANIGSVILDAYGNDVRNRAKAYAAAGSDARMNGCELPVVITSGSGNQGMTVSLPVIQYARELEVSDERLYRALIISNLTAIHIKQGIGALSAYCGAISAGCAAGAGIAYLRGGDLEAINHTIVNAIAITSGIVCDGAKASCAAKIATAIDAGIIGFDMYQRGQNFCDGEGIVSNCVEKTILNVGRLGRQGMRKTDEEILDIMTCVD